MSLIIRRFSSSRKWHGFHLWCSINWLFVYCWMSCRIRSSIRIIQVGLFPNASTNIFHGRLARQILIFGDVDNPTRTSQSLKWSPPNSSIPSTKKQYLASKSERVDSACKVLNSSEAVQSAMSSPLIPLVCPQRAGQTFRRIIGLSRNISYSKVRSRPSWDFCMAVPALQN
jgi:hypothetical protein